MTGKTLTGVFGGTFDPVHYGHLKPAQAVMQALHLSRVRFVPNRLPPHREQPWLSVEQRVALLELALQSYSGFVLDRCELGRNGPSYMIDTLISLKQAYPEETLCLILGQDAFNGFENWHRWQEVFQYCHLLITPRPGFGTKQITTNPFMLPRITRQREDLLLQAEGRILLQSVPQLAISSTDIRQRLQQLKRTGGDVSQARMVEKALVPLLPASVLAQLKRFLEND